MLKALYCMAELVHGEKKHFCWWLVPWAVRISLYGPLKWVAHERISLICVFEKLFKRNSFVLIRIYFLGVWPKLLAEVVRKWHEKSYSFASELNSFHRRWSFPHSSFCRIMTFIHYIGVDFYTFGPPDCVRFNEDFVISRLCFILFTVTNWPGWKISFVIPRTWIYRGSLNRSSTVRIFRICSARICRCVMLSESF